MIELENLKVEVIGREWLVGTINKEKWFDIGFVACAW